ncbi:MAG: AMP-binding protein [Ornithinimicrobium sp.]
MNAATEHFRQARDHLLQFRTDYDAAVAGFAWPEVGATFNWAHDWFDEIATENDIPALVVIGQDGQSTSVTFEQMRRRSNQTARWLAGRGVRQGDSVIVMLGNQVELWVSMLAIMKIGAVIMPTTTAVGPADLRDRIARGEVRHVIANAAAVDTFEDVPGDYTRISVGHAEGWADLTEASSQEDSGVTHPQTAPGDRLLLYFTSGTTNRPKLVEHTQVSYPVGHLSTMYWLGLQPGDVHLNISSPGWAKHAWSCFFAPWIAEATICVLDYATFDAADLLERLRQHEVTSLCAPPTVWRMLIKADMGSRPPALREVIGAGEPLNPEVISQVQDAWGLPLRDGFGQTEMTAAVGNTPGSALKPGSMGRPLPGLPVVLVDPASGTPVAPGGEGEICLELGGPSGRPLPLMTGYQGDVSRNTEAMSDGFYHTGDVATIDDEGYITYVGRTDDVFKASDYKISPFELESVLIEHPAVAEAAIVAAPDEVRLAVPKAYVTLAAGFEPDEDTAYDILRYAREHLPAYQRVRRLEFAELPKTISGKIRRVELREREQQLSAAGDVAAHEWRDDHLRQSGTS